MNNLLLNYDREKLFEAVIQNGVFDKYEEQLGEDDYNDLLNEIVYFVGTLEAKIVKE
jgi:hypothetical protein